MQQRRLRLGDIVDDYCPRERRITNHAIVAMIEDEVKQTRCTTCDADHDYKQARMPVQRRRKDAAAGAPGELVAGTPRRRPESETSEPAEVELEPIGPPDAEAASLDASPEESAEPVAAAAEPFDDSDIAGPTPPAEDEGPVHRRLIRATLPRPEGQAPERKLPDFTIHQREVNGNRAGGRHRRGPRQGQMRSQQGSQPRHGSGQPPRHGSGQGSRQGSGQAPRHGSGHTPRHGSGHTPRHGSGQGPRHGEERDGNRADHGQGGPPRHNRGRKRGR